MMCDEAESRLVQCERTKPVKSTWTAFSTAAVASGLESHCHVVPNYNVCGCNSFNRFRVNISRGIE